MAKILLVSLAKWGKYGKDICYKHTMAYAKQLVLQGHKVDWTCQFLTPLDYGSGPEQVHNAKPVSLYRSWSEYDIIIAKTIDKTFSEAWQNHHATQVSKLSPNQRLFFCFDDLELGWSMPNEADLIDWGFDYAQITRYLDKKPDAIVSDHQGFLSMWQGYGSAPEWSPEVLPWYWNAQTLWDSLEKPVLDNTSPVQLKQWSIGYHGFNKPSRAVEIRRLLIGRPKGITLATFGQISTSIHDYRLEKSFSQEALGGIMASIWTTLYLIDSKVLGKHSTRLYECLDSSATMLLPTDQGLSELLQPWSFNSPEQLWERIIEFSRPGTESCQLGLANQIAKEHWSKYEQLGLIKC